MNDIHDASARLDRFAPLLETLFSELKESHGIIESQLLSVPKMWEDLKKRSDFDFPGHLWLKADHSLPVAGSFFLYFYSFFSFLFLFLVIL